MNRWLEQHHLMQDPRSWLMLVPLLLLVAVGVALMAEVFERHPIDGLNPYLFEWRKRHFCGKK